jgi:hypothetical protein
MKNTILFLFVLSFSIPLSAQKSLQDISIGYYTPFFVEFGGKISTSIHLKKWETTNSKDVVRNKTIYISPQIGYFVKPKNHDNYLFNCELGCRSQKADKKWYGAATFGLGYLLTSHIVSGSVNLGTGEITKERENISSLLPTLNYEFGKTPTDKMGYYFKLFAGRKIAFGAEGAGFYGAELGLKFNLQNASKN